MNEKYYIYYNDDWAELGGMGFKEFNTKEEVIDFIMERYKKGKEKAFDLNDYIIIKGKKMLIKIVETIKTLRLED